MVLRNIKINLSINYINIPLSKEILKSQSKEYVNKFIIEQKNKNLK